MVHIKSEQSVGHLGKNLQASIEVNLKKEELMKNLW
jgi:hypothetical protein